CQLSTTHESEPRPGPHLDAERRAPSSSIVPTVQVRAPAQPAPSMPWGGKGSEAPLRGSLAANRLHDLRVLERTARMPLEDDLAAVDRVEAVGDPGGRHEVRLRGQERDAPRPDLLDRGDEAAHHDRRPALEQLRPPGGLTRHR